MAEGMKERELRAVSKCALCGRPFGHTGLPLFWRVTVERWGVDADAVRRQDGFATFIGSSALAGIMGPDDDMAHRITGPIRVTICEPCSQRPVELVVYLGFAQEGGDAS